ncbi:MAG TPA: hypothetical protein VFD51_01000 [Patescibacteria group bacterium]|nr:hypothetical protein [Patescibacteria group bacterium]
MFSKRLRKILDLAKKTGDRVVIFDGSDSENSYVISSIDRYLDSENKNEEVENKNKEVENKNKEVENKKKGLADANEDLVRQLENSEDPIFSGEKENRESLTEEDLTDRINQEISIWKNQNKSSDLSEEDKVKKSWKIPPAVKNKAHDIE